MYGADDAEIVSNCALPPLATCIPGQDECCEPGRPCTLTCQANAEIDSSVGICVREGTCSQHRHCASLHMCSGDGLCVPLTLFFTNHLDVAVDL